MTTTVFDPVAHATAVLALLNSVTGLTVYDGEVPDTPPADAMGRVNAYAVLYASAAPSQRDAIAGPSTRFPWSFQVTAVGGDRQRCSWAVKAVCGALVDQRLTVAGFTSSPIGQDTGPGMGRDDTVVPPRLFQPLLFSLLATPA